MQRARSIFCICCLNEFPNQARPLPTPKTNDSRFTAAGQSDHAQDELDAVSQLNHTAQSRNSKDRAFLLMRGPRMVFYATQNQRAVAARIRSPDPSNIGRSLSRPIPPLAPRVPHHPHVTRECWILHVARVIKSPSARLEILYHPIKIRGRHIQLWIEESPRFPPPFIRVSFCTPSCCIHFATRGRDVCRAQRADTHMW